MAETVRWTTDTNVVRTIAEDSFHGWEDAVAEAVKNCLDARPRRISISLPDRELLVPLAEQTVVIEDDGIGMTKNELESEFCRVGRPKGMASKAGPSGPRMRIYGTRGTGKIASFVVARRVRIRTWRAGKASILVLDTDELMRSTHAPAGEKKFPIEMEPVKRGSSGTRLELSGFRTDTPPPSVGQIHHILLRHFHHVDKVRFVVNDEVFSATDHAEPVLQIDGESVEGVGEVSGQVWLARKPIKEPGLIVFSDGQRIDGPSLFGLEQRGYKGDPGKSVSRIIGHVTVAPENDVSIRSGVWSLSQPFALLQKWMATALDGIIDARTGTFVEERVDRWLKDPQARREYEQLDDASKATAKRILGRRAKRAGDSTAGAGAEKIIARLVLRCLRTSGLEAVLTALDEASDDTLGDLAELLGGDDPWTMRQVVGASSTVKLRMRAIDDLDRLTGDYTTNEREIHRLLEANPWIIADEYYSFRSNRQIKTTLEKIFAVKVNGGRGTRKRPDMFFVLGDAASTAGDTSSRYLFVELKGPDQPLSRKHQGQATGDAMTFLRHRPGYAFTVLLGTEVDDNDPPDDDSDSRGQYAFKSMTYEKLLYRARFRLGYLMEGVEATKAEDFVRKVLERQVNCLVEQ